MDITIILLTIMLYIIPLLMAYFLTRIMLKIKKRKPNVDDFLLVVIPVLNIIATILIFGSIVGGFLWLVDLEKFFALNKKEKKQ